MSIKVYVNNGKYEQALETNYFVFSDGAVHIELRDLEEYKIEHVSTAKIVARVTKSDDIFAVLNITDALRRMYGNIDITLVLPMLPYARADKAVTIGEPIALKVFANIINSQNYSKVITYDVHSDTSLAIFDNLKNITQRDIISSLPKKMVEEFRGKVLIVPDQGASKKSYKIAEIIKPEKIVQCDKARDNSGKIIRTVVFSTHDELYAKDCIIFDDLIDYMGSMINIAKVLKNDFRVNSVTAFATHTILPDGPEHALNNCIDKIITCDTFREKSEYDSRIIVNEIVNKLV